MKLSNVDFYKVSFSSIENCVNLELLGLKFSKGLELESMDPCNCFKNLNSLELSLNLWSSKVTALIIEKAGNNLTSLIIGEKTISDTINDDTLRALTMYCPKIKSLSISSMSHQKLNMLFSYIRDLRLNTLLLGCEIEKNFKDLSDYIESQNSLSIFGTNADYMNVLDLLKKHKIKRINYEPFTFADKQIIIRLLLHSSSNFVFKEHGESFPFTSSSFWSGGAEFLKQIL